jgi:Lipocalin-like domain
MQHLMISGIPVGETSPLQLLINNISGGIKIATSVRVCMNDEQLVGAWGLVSWENRAADGGVSYPMGADARGFLIYSRDGAFSVTISRANRVGFTGDDLLGGTVLEKANECGPVIRGLRGAVYLCGASGHSSRRAVPVPELGGNAAAAAR